MAPELYTVLIGLASGNFRSSPASDSYSLAMTLLEIITLEHPFPECGTQEAAGRQALEGVRPPRPAQLLDLQPNVIERLWELFEVMWTAEPESRPRLDAVLVSLEHISSLVPPCSFLLDKSWFLVPDVERSGSLSV